MGQHVKIVTVLFSTIYILLAPVYGQVPDLQQQVSSPRSRANFDEDWQFHKGDIAIKRAVKAGMQGGLTNTNVKVVTGEEAIIAYTDKNKVADYKRVDWKQVSLPHDWLVEENFVHDNTIGSQPAGNGYLPGGVGFYRKEFEIPDTDKGKKISIEFDGIFRNSTVWVNGHCMGNHQSGYTPSSYDLTDVLRYGREGKNVILVKVDATDYEGWWYEGAGIYRHVWLTKTNSLHIARFGTFITTPAVSANEAFVSMRSTLQNEDHLARQVMVVSKIIDKQGAVCDTQSMVQALAPYSKTEVAQKGLIQKPLRWWPETPNLYKVITEVLENGTLIDKYETTFGVRTIEVNVNGFFLNGKLYPVKGTANHQDFAGVGVAVPDKINEYRIQLLKEMGCNGYRSAHNPPTPELLDLCDRLGMLVLDENRLLSGTEEGIKDLATLIYRDRNHPSVFMWSMENEESLEGNITGTRILEKLVETTRQLDSTRPITAAMNHGWNEGGYSDMLDVVGYNYGQRGMQYVKDRERFPQRKMFVTESTSYVSTRGEYEDNKEKGYVSNFGVNGQLQRMARYPNYDTLARFLDGTAADAVSKERVARWRSPEGGYVHALHRSEWGDFHYLITGKDEHGEVTLEGGWQNNRQMGMHKTHRFVENIFEELDTAGEWFYDKKNRTLYFFPPRGLDIRTAIFESPQLTHLFEFRGTEAGPVTNIRLRGISLTQTVRTFMQNKEPLLRSDWTIYRGGAVLYNGAVDCSLKNCNLYNLGGNAVFFNNFNRNCEVSGCLIFRVGASAVCFVGDPHAVRSPSFEYNEFVPLAQLDRTPGPKTNNYPADCNVNDNLLFDLGFVEKQSAGVELSMCFGITVSHNTIYDVPRAGINVSEGTWGGHLIEYNDIFNTVKESGDHGSFNSWGRDRYWHPDKRVLDSIVATNFNLALLDVTKPIVLRNNRMRCDHGWDIDLDDGSGNYWIYNNLCLNGGIKLREGVNRVVENNIMVNNTFHPHLWFQNSNDVFRRNIVATGYKPINVPVWGKEVDYNVFPDSVSLKEAWSRRTDTHSVCGPLLFEEPAKGDFRLKAGSIAFFTGFRNFAMDSFGVVSPRLKAPAKKAPLPAVIALDKVNDNPVIDFMGAKVKNLVTPGERSATGMDGTRGVLVLEVAPGSAAAGFLQVNDVILSFNGVRVNTLRDLLEARMTVIGSGTEVVIFRNQQEMKMRVELNGGK